MPVINHLTTEKKKSYIFLDIENIGANIETISSDYKYVAVGHGKDNRERLQKLKDKYEFIDVVWLDISGDQVSDMYIYSEATKIKTLNSKNEIIVISKDGDFKKYKEISSCIDIIKPSLEEFYESRVKVVKNQPTEKSTKKAKDKDETLNKEIDSLESKNVISKARGLELKKIVKIHYDVLNGKILNDKKVRSEVTTLINKSKLNTVKSNLKVYNYLSELKKGMDKKKEFPKI